MQPANCTRAFGSRGSTLLQAHNTHERTTCCDVFATQPQILMLTQLWVNVKCEGLLTQNSRTSPVGKLKGISLSLSIHILYIYIYIHTHTHIGALLSASFGRIPQACHVLIFPIPLNPPVICTFSILDFVYMSRLYRRLSHYVLHEHLPRIICWTLPVCGSCLLVGALISGLSLGTATFSRTQANPKLKKSELCKLSSIFQSQRTSMLSRMERRSPTIEISMSREPVTNENKSTYWWKKGYHPTNYI